MIIVKWIFLSLILFGGTLAIIFQKKRYSQIQFVFLFTTFLMLFGGALISSIWHNMRLLSWSSAISALLAECLLIVSPSDGWPKLYVCFLHIGFVLLILSTWSIALWHLYHHWATSTPYHISAIIGFAGGIILAVSFGFLRPKGKPWDEIF